MFLKQSRGRAGNAVELVFAGAKIAALRRLFLITLCFCALLTKVTPEASQSRLGTIESLVERGTYRLDDSTFIHTIDKIYKDGHYYSHQPPLLSTLEAPVYWVLHLSGARFHNRGRMLLTYSFTLLTSGVAVAATVVVIAGILELASGGALLNSALPIWLVLGTWLLPYGLVANNHVVSGCLLAMLSWLLLESEWRAATRRGALAIGGVLGLLSAIEVLPLVSFLPVTVIYLMSRRRFDASGWALFALGLTAPLLAHALINFQITGDVIPAGFHTELFTFEGTGFDAGSLTGSLKHHSLRDVSMYAWRSLFAGKGFFIFAPLCLAGLICGLVEWRWWLSRAAGVYAVLLSGTAISVFIAVLTTNNFGGSSVGFRHAVYLSPAFIVLLLPWLVGNAPRRRAAVTAIAVASTISMSVFAARAPWSGLTVFEARIGSWDEYVPLAGHIVHGDLFIP